MIFRPLVTLNPQQISIDNETAPSIRWFRREIVSFEEMPWPLAALDQIHEPLARKVR
jgi:hypothetical protein